MNRGADKQGIYRDDTDRRGFLALLPELAARWDVETHAYALMGNHFHLLLRDPAGRLSRAMGHLQGVYTQRFNRRHSRDGALMRGRFKSRVVQADDYLMELVRYIHTNPVATGDASVAGEYPWCSHRFYLGIDRPSWLETAEVFRRVGGDSPSGRAALDRFVHGRVDPEVRRRIESECGPRVLGDEAFESAARQDARRDGHADPGERFRPFAGLKPMEIVEAVAQEACVAPESITGSCRGATNPLRRLALTLCVDHSPATEAEIAATFGLRRRSVASLAVQWRSRLAADPSLRELHGRLLTNPAAHLGGG